MDTQNNTYFWQILERFNLLMKGSIEGPNCTDPKKCHGDCCSIKIDVPRVLAEWYIERGFAKETDFIRSNIFSFHLRFDENTGKCFLFDIKQNGCRVHSTGRKPPQCWIYPTGFSTHSSKECKRLGGWRITNLKNTKEAEELLKQYVFLCQIEALKERNKIKDRLKYSIPPKKSKNSVTLVSYLKSIPPSALGGFKDTWSKIKFLSAEGYSLQMKKFCKRFNPSCELSETDFLNCEHMCDKIVLNLIKYLDTHIKDYIKSNGPEVEGEYPLFKLFNGKLDENIKDSFLSEGSHS